MEIQEPSPRILISALRFGKVSPLLFDVRGELIDRMTGELGLSEWNATPDTFQLFTTDQRRLVQVSIRDVFVSVEHFDDFEEVVSWVEGALATATEALGVATISWMGTRMHWLSASDSFRSLCAWFQERFGVLGSTAAGAVGRNTSDLGAVFEFKDADPLVSVRIGPMKAEQAMAQFFRDKSPSRYPEQFLFVDVDRVWANETLDSSKAIASWKQRVNELAALGDGLARAVAAS